MSRDVDHGQPATRLDGVAIELLVRGHRTPHEIVTLSDADLLALDGVDGVRVSPLPWLGPRDRATREVAAEIGWRQLAARDLAAVDYGPTPTLRVSARVQATLQMRRSAAAVTIAQQEASFGTNTLVIYNQGESGSLVEAVDGYGLHRFTTMTSAVAADALLQFVVPTQRFAVDDLVTGEFDSLSWRADTGFLAQALTVSVVSVTSRAPANVVERRLSVYALPDRAIVAEPVADRLLVREATQPTVAAAIRGLSAEHG